MSQSGTVNASGGGGGGVDTITSVNLEVTTSGTSVDLEDLRFTTGYVVDTSVVLGSKGTYTTIQSAVTAANAAGGGIVFVRAGSYSELVTVPSNVTITGYSGETFNSTSSQTVLTGALIFSGVTNVNVYNMVIKSDGTNVPIQLAGSASTQVTLTNLTVQSAATSVVTSSNASAVAYFNECYIYQDGAFPHFTLTNGFVDCSFCYIGAVAANTSTASPLSGSAGLVIQESIMSGGISLSGTSTLYGIYSNIGANGIGISTGSTGAVDLYYCFVQSLTSAAAINISSGSSVLASYCSLLSNSGTQAITGSGALSYDLLSFTTGSNGSLSGTLTITQLVVRPFATANSTNTTALRGLSSYNSAQFSVDSTGYVSLLPISASDVNGSTSGVAPAPGIIGEQISSFVSSGSAISVSTTATNYNITSITLSAGIWDVSGVVVLLPQAGYAGQFVFAAISTTFAGGGNLGDSGVESVPPTVGVNVQTMTIPSYRLTLSVGTVVYLTAGSNFSAGSMSGWGRISATRVG